MLDLAATIDEVPIAIVDVETTGLDPYSGDRVCEVAVLRVQTGDETDALQVLVNPQRLMDPRAEAVHGISDDMLADAPPFGEVADDVLEVLDDAVVLGHNTPFDLGFIAAELERIERVLPTVVALDTLRLARRTFTLRSYALGRLSDALGVAIRGTAHRAMVDVIQTRAVFERILDELWPRGVRTVNDLIAHQGGPLAQPAPPLLNAPEPIKQALRDRRHLWLVYDSESGGRTERIVRPLGVRETGRGIVLVAHCLLRDALRHFRVDRIVEMEIVDPSA